VEIQGVGIAGAHRHFGKGLSRGRQKLPRPPHASLEDDVAVAYALVLESMLQRAARQADFGGGDADPRALQVVVKFERDEHRFRHSRGQRPVAIGRRSFDGQVRRQAQRLASTCPLFALEMRVQSSARGRTQMSRRLSSGRAAAP